MTANQKNFIRYVSSNVLGMLGISCYILADTFFIANGVGSSGLTALNLILPVYSFLNGLGLMLGMGGATTFAILKSKNALAEAETLFTRTLKLTIALGLLLTAAGVAFAEPLVRLLGAEGEIVALSASYIRTICTFAVAFMVNNMVLCFVRNDGEPSLAMAGMVFGSLSNVLLDYIFIFPLQMGMFGGALATSISPVLSLLVLSLHWKRKKSTIHLRRCGMCLKETFQAVSLGTPSFITEMSSGVTILLFNLVILSLTGNLGVAAYGVIANVALVVVAVFTGIAQGIQPLISVNFGLEKRDTARRIYKLALALALMLGLLCWAGGSFFAVPIVGIFNNADDPALSAIAVRGIRLYFSSFVFAGVNIVTISYLASIAKGKKSFFISLVRGLAAVIPAVFLLPAFWGMDGVWLAIPVVELVTLIICLLTLTRRS